MNRNKCWLRGGKEYLSYVIGDRFVRQDELCGGRNNAKGLIETPVTIAVAIIVRQWGADEFQYILSAWRAASARQL